MKLEMALVAGLFAFGFALSAAAGPMEDFDGDLVPHQYDNCSQYPNGPNQLSNQVDTDLDGWGNACDADFTNVVGSVPPFIVSGADVNIFVANFGSSSPAAKE